MACVNHNRCVEDALDQAEQLCLARGARLTPIRRTVLAEIWADHEATKAYDLISRLSREGAEVKPPTIYRALEFLLAHGLVHRIESLNAFVGCNHPQTQHQAIMMICTQCGDIQEQASAPVTDTLRAAAEHNGFDIHHQTIELRGRCARCRQATADPSAH